MREQNNFEALADTIQTLGLRQMEILRIAIG